MDLRKTEKNRGIKVLGPVRRAYVHRKWGRRSRSRKMRNRQENQKHKNIRESA
jgi:hypothetical protein